MKKTILVDFGASRIKSIYPHLKEKFFFENSGSIEFNSDKFHPIFFYEKLKKHLIFYQKKNIEINEIYISSEMHGFFLINSTNQKFSPYFSWRFKSKKKNNQRKINYLKKHLFSKTGLKFRDGIPAVNFYKEGLSKDGFDLVGGVAESICFFGGKYQKKISLSYAHSTGFYNLNGKSFLNAKFKNKVSKKIKVDIGYIFFKKKKIKIICGLGDMQAAYIGMSSLKSDIVLNIGTGSQIMSENKEFSSILKERRPINTKKKLYCITHIPSGKALLNFKNQIFDHRKKSKVFWKTLRSINEKDISKVESKINMKKLYNGNNIENYLIKKNTKDLCAMFMKAYLDQYIKIIMLCKKKVNKFKINLSGGIPKKLPLIEKILIKNCNLNIYKKKSRIEDALAGLLKIKNNQFS